MAAKLTTRMLTFLFLTIFLQLSWTAPTVDICSPDDHRILILGQVVLRFNVTELLPQEMGEMIRWIDSFGADFIFSNLETAINGTYAQENGAELNNITPHAADVSTLDVLKTFLINMWTTANNHIYDLGPAGITSTLEEMAARSMHHTGAGRNLAEAIKPLYLTKKGQTWGLHAVVSAPGLVTFGGIANETHPGSNSMILNTTTQTFDPIQHELQLETISDMCHEADIPLSYHHAHGLPPAGGYIVPDWRRNYAHEVIDHGASMYIGQGPTNLYPIEIYNGQLILYGTGSFFFQTQKPDGSYPNITSWQGVVTDVCYAKGSTELKQVRLIPILLSPQGLGTPNSEIWFKTLGVPARCNNSMANDILIKLRDASASFGTKIKIDHENGIGYVVVPPKKEQLKIPHTCRRYRNLMKNGIRAEPQRVKGRVYGVGAVLTLMSLMIYSKAPQKITTELIRISPTAHLVLIYLNRFGTSVRELLGISKRSEQKINAGCAGCEAGINTREIGGSMLSNHRWICNVYVSGS